MNIKKHVAIFSIWSHLVFSLKTCFRGSTIQTSGETTKRIPIGTKFCTRLRINLGIDICRQKNVAPRDTRWAFGILGGQKYKSLGNLPNGWTNWQKNWYISANSSGNGHRLKTIGPWRSHEGFLGFYGVNYQKAGKDGQTARPIGTKLWAIYSVGSVNGHRLKNIGPVRHQGEHFNPRLIRGNIWGIRGSTFHRKSGYDRLAETN